MVCLCKTIQSQLLAIEFSFFLKKSKTSLGDIYSTPTGYIYALGIPYFRLSVYTFTVKNIDSFTRTYVTTTYVATLVPFNVTHTHHRHVLHYFFWAQKEYARCGIGQRFSLG